MKERIQITRSGLFAIELVIDIGIFCFCAAVCLGLFVRSEVISRDSADLTYAVSWARNAAECFKAAGGNMPLVESLTGGAYISDADMLEIYYDANWKLLPHASPNPTFIIQLTKEESASDFTEVILSVKKGEEEFFSWSVSTLVTLNNREAER